MSVIAIRKILLMHRQGLEPIERPRFPYGPRGLPAAVIANLAELAEKVVIAKRSTNNKELEALIATDQNIAALGRFVATLAPIDLGKFRTPSLRNVALTAPYMMAV